MKRTIITLSLILASLATFSQRTQTSSDSVLIQQLQQSVRQLQTELRKQKADFSQQLSATNDSLALLRLEIAIEKKNTVAVADKLELQIADTKTEATQQIQNVNDNLSANTLYWIIAVLTIALLSVVLFVLLRKKQKSDKTDLIEQLSQTKISIEESLVKEFDKQTELMETQLETLKQQKANTSTPVSAELDHSLALKLASEINLIERNIKLMDAGTKGLKQLNRSVEKLKDNLAANGYEMPQLLGKQFHQGMKVIVASSIPDDNLDKGSEVITKILIPQVNYNGKMIQTAQIEVSVG
ncbi:MAG: hypothetical protein LBS55_11575 [Prevotellaceae bacterium]|jgi:hypothetical protein|nr:hypothetical protein [Prevotellaceae bacterium]